MDSNLLSVLLGVVIIGSTASVIGCFALLRKQSLIGDAIAHALLPGICLAFILFETKNIFILLLGAAITGWLSLVLIDLIVSKSKLKTDSAISIVLSVFFGFGIMLLT
ncbi:MAG: zinc ABC transporter permease, partial [Bacteroidia bacterium]|nr:zinc ABC transporter permease [Bacteroidia bacterium]